MEIKCANKCGNLTDTPEFDECKTCRESNQSSFLDVICYLLDENSEISPSWETKDNTALIDHKNKHFKITVEEIKNDV